MDGRQDYLMHLKYAVVIVPILGLITLFLFPEPENHFLLYFSSALFFIALTAALVSRLRKEQH